MARPSTPPWSDQLLAWHRRTGRRGFHALWKLRRRLGGRPDLQVPGKFGGVFAVRPYDAVDQCVLAHGYYESEVIAALRPFFGAGAVFWDVGANFGLHAVTAKLLAPAMTVVAFEPNAREAARLRRHADLNHVAVQVEEVALTDATGSRVLHVITEGNSGMSTLHQIPATSYAAHVAVECHTARNLVDTGRVPPPTVMKIDVEGSEAEVLAGLGPLLHEQRLRALVIEAELGLEHLTERHPIATPLREAGFSLAPLTRREPTHHALGNYAATRRP